MKVRNETIRPGKGLESIVLFESESDTKQLLKLAPKVTQYDDVRWLEYLELGFDVCIDNSSSQVTAISLFREGIEGHSGFAGKTEDGIGLGASEIEIIARYGQASESGIGHQYSDGHRSRRWISYKTGIAFEFSLQDDHVDRIAIFPVSNS
jgi:hypothetical protein